MKRQLLPTVLLLVLLNAVVPARVHSQERVRLFDIEVDDYYTLADPGRAALADWWRIDGTGGVLFDQETTLLGVTYPQLLVIEGDELFLVDGVDGTRVLVYSLPDLGPKMSFGADGHGPDDFRVRPGHRIGLDVTADTIVVTDGGRVARFDRSGGLIEEISFPFWTQWDFKSLGSGFVGQGSDPDDYSYLLNVYDAELRPVRELLRVANPVSAEGGPIRVLTTSLQYSVHDGEIYAWGHTPDLVIDVFDAGGNRVRSLRPQYDRVPVAEEIKAMILEAYGANAGFAGQAEDLRDRLVFPSHFPAIWTGYVDDGKIYLLTYERQGWEFRMLVLDTAGNALGSALLPVRLSPANTPYPATVHQGRWYQVAMNHETGDWDLLVLDIQF